MSKETILKTVNKCIENTQTKKTGKTGKKRTKKAKKTKKTKAKKPFNWKAIQKLVDSPKTPEAPKKAWKEALKYHNQGLTDNEVRKKMGWNK